MKSYSTRHRKALEEYLAAHVHEDLSVRQIAEGIGSDTMSPSAVYRNMRLMEAEGKVSRVARPKSRQALYQYTASPSCRNRIHITCSRCGRIRHMSDEEENEFMKGLALRDLFFVDPSKTVIYGICGECRNAAGGDL